MNMRKSCKDLIVIRVDGGICSQIAFVALGLQLQTLGNRVKYDLSWYQHNGKDMTGAFVRNWDFPKAFPSIGIEEATLEEIDYLRTRHFRVGEMVKSFRPPLYIGGYPDRSEAILSKRSTLRDAFKPELDDCMRKSLNEIAAHPSCAVHVRRGDLANVGVYYGGATSTTYFKRAMTMIAGLEPGVKFFFYSDEPDWVRRELLPLVSPDRAVVMDANGSDKGYLDLYLMAQSEYVIASIGSLGVFAGVLSSRNRMLMLSSVQDWVSGGVPNVCYLNDDYGRRAVAARDEMLVGVNEQRLRGVGRHLFRLWRKFVV